MREIKIKHEDLTPIDSVGIFRFTNNIKNEDVELFYNDHEQPCFDCLADYLKGWDIKLIDFALKEKYVFDKSKNFLQAIEVKFIEKINEKEATSISGSMIEIIDKITKDVKEDRILFIGYDKIHEYIFYMGNRGMEIEVDDNFGTQFNEYIRIQPVKKLKSIVLTSGIDFEYNDKDYEINIDEVAQVLDIKTSFGFKYKIHNPKIWKQNEKQNEK